MLAAVRPARQAALDEGRDLGVDWITRRPESCDFFSAEHDALSSVADRGNLWLDRLVPVEAEVLDPIAKAAERLADVGVRR